MKNYKAVCFDFDYTLADCTDSIVAGFVYGFTRLGHPAPERETVRRTVGLMLEDAYTLLTGDPDPVNQQKFRSHFIDAAMERQRRETVFLPGGEELLLGLKEKGVLCGIVSSKRGDTIDIVLKRLGVKQAVPLVIGSADVTRHKPHPEGLLKAMEELGVSPEETLYCGDTVLDAEAAKEAGCDFVAVLNGTTPASAFEVWPCIHISPDLDDLARWLGVM